MIKKIQNYLLINHPLLWNTKVVPASVILIVINLIFVAIGYNVGELNFKENETSYEYSTDGTIMTFCVLLSVLSLILWLVSYLKNNSFKSLYPKSRLSLFKEWAIIVFVSLLLCSFTSSFYFGKDVKRRSYFTEAEAKKRCEILSKGSYFVEGSYSNNYNDITAVPVDTNYVLFKGKKYGVFSMINKNLNSYTFFDYDSDSIRKVKIRTFLVDQQKDSLKKIFRDYLAIAKEHELRANINENEWLDLIYDYPDFEEYKLIGGSGEPEQYFADNYNQNNRFDSINNKIIFIKGMKYEVPRWYVPENNLKYNYSKISDSWQEPAIDSSTLLISFYFAIFLSLFIFSFRVTSGRSWLIAVISVGVLSIVYGLFSVLASSVYSFPILSLLTVLFAFFYFLATIARNKGKNISGIILNALLWLMPSFLPLIYFLVMEYLKYLNMGYPLREGPYYEQIDYMEDNAVVFFYLNIAFIIGMMLFFSFKIKKWKGVAES